MTAPQHAPTVSAEEFETLHATPWRIPAPIVRVSRPWYVRAWLTLTRPIRRGWYAYRERCVREEREGYQDRGIPLGPNYLKNCADQERDYRSRQAFLDLE